MVLGWNMSIHSTAFSAQGKNKVIALQFPQTNHNVTNLKAPVAEFENSD